MRCLTIKQCIDWCHEFGFEVDASGMSNSSVTIAPIQFALPTDSGKKIALSRLVYSLVSNEEPEILIWITGWGIWPSCEHFPLFTRFREACGEVRSLNETPGHILTSDQSADALSLITMASLFYWDFHIISKSKTTIFFSHDEFGQFSSVDLNKMEEGRQQLAAFVQ